MQKDVRNGAASRKRRLIGAATYIPEYMEARGPVISTVIDAAIKLRGVRAINQALAQKRQG